MTSYGVVYVAIGDRFVSRLNESVRSLVEAMPEIDITVFSDVEISEPHCTNVPVVPSPIHHWDKIVCMGRSPYDRTVFLDADTYVCDEISELFDLLDRFDIAAAHDTYRAYVKDFDKIRSQLERVPKSFSILNSGVVAYRMDNRVLKFFENWRSIHERNVEITPSGGGDQPAFREALFNSDLQISVLPPEYNCRFVTPVFVNERVKILHGPFRDFRALEKEVNGRVGNRAFFPTLGTVFDDDSPLKIRGWRLREWKFRVLKRVKRVAKRWMRAN